MGRTKGAQPIFGTALSKWVVTTSKFTSDLLVCGSAPGDEHDMETSETADRDDEQADDDHDHDRRDRLQ